MTEDPWRDLAPPAAAETVNARRVDAKAPFDFFWARDADRNCLLVLRHRSESATSGRLPKLRGIEINESRNETSDQRTLSFRLLDSTHRDIFYHLCADIVTSSQAAASEKEAVDVALARTWRWHYLLRSGTDERLSQEEQKGLIGELIVLERVLLPLFKPSESLKAWRGPLDAPKDFEIGRVCIEAKARRGAAAPYVAISSEYQLDDAGTDALFLHVSEIDQAPTDAPKGFTISTAAERIRDVISAKDNGAIEAFETLLAAAGFRWDDDYSDSFWIEGTSRIYQISPGFPRILLPSEIHGISHVRYSVALSECGPFRVDDQVLTAALGRVRNAD
jgi:hypothetical protein